MGVGVCVLHPNGISTRTASSANHLTDTVTFVASTSRGPFYRFAATTAILLRTARYVTPLAAVGKEFSPLAS